MEETLTLTGKKANQRLLECLIQYDSNAELKLRVRELLDGNLEGYIVERGFYKDGWNTHNCLDELIDCLKGLPENHEIVTEILTQSNSILEIVPKMSLFELSAMEERSYWTTIPILKAFDICDIVQPEYLFDNLKKASYHVLNGHVQYPMKHLACRAISGIVNYKKLHSQEILEFAQFLDKNKLGTAYMLRLYADFGKERALPAFIEALEQNRTDIHFQYVAKSIKKTLFEKGFSSVVFKKYRDSITDQTIRCKFGEYFKIE